MAATVANRSDMRQVRVESSTGIAIKLNYTNGRRHFHGRKMFSFINLGDF